ncbi:hypothetical protein QBC45DRAFT_451509 [Copromyces sp. CBS 386.78]|nr:hypothetical protein QBC45DRAFT_451509 [Copromyces sp. CBS 386.78]
MPICILGPHRALVDLPCCLPLSSPPMRGALLHEYVAYDTARKHVVLPCRGPAPGDGHYQRKMQSQDKNPPGQGSRGVQGNLLMFCLAFRPVKIPRCSTRLI